MFIVYIMVYILYFVIFNIQYQVFNANIIYIILRVILKYLIYIYIHFIFCFWGSKCATRPHICHRSASSWPSGMLPLTSGPSCARRFRHLACTSFLARDFPKLVSCASRTSFLLVELLIKIASPLI